MPIQYSPRKLSIRHVTAFKFSKSLDKKAMCKAFHRFQKYLYKYFHHYKKPTFTRNKLSP